MKLQIIAIRDIKADCYGQPNFVASIGAAIRSFGDECQREDQNNMLWKHPEDFELYHLGEYDDSCGEFSSKDGESDIHKAHYTQIAIGSNYKRTT